MTLKAEVVVKMTISVICYRAAESVSDFAKVWKPAV